MLKTIFSFLLGLPLPRGVPGEGPDCQSQGDQGFGADSGPDPGGYIFLISIVALSTARTGGAQPVPHPALLDDIWGPGQPFPANFGPTPRLG